ncbi:MAG: BrnT family toxin [Deltaproteobacteria bacterium]|nr:BrnT family toxin [Deltaproteobacteria bacterium]MBI4412039.1 BrnT family toxin [Deltaproteobacteria bacterium]
MRPCGELPEVGDEIDQADPIHSAGEERFITVGQSGRGMTVVVAHTDRDGTIKIVSARPATKKEIRDYEEK